MPDASPSAGAAAAATGRYMQPVKRITSLADVAAFQRSKAYHDISQFINMLQQGVHRRTISGKDYPVSPAVRALCTALETIGMWIREIPLAAEPKRFGNPAFRTWHARLTEHAPAMVRGLLHPVATAAAEEAVPYWIESFGNPTRLDYGTGHETSMLAFLCIAHKLGVFTPDDASALGLQALTTYLRVVRTLQHHFCLESAGSHGVWSLDDYQALPFLLGAAQLIGTSIPPADALDANRVRMWAPNYLYFACILFILETKRGPFAAHSPVLDGLARLETWESVHDRVTRVYNHEVLSNFPLLQHFLFGSVLAFEPPPPDG